MQYIEYTKLNCLAELEKDEIQLSEYVRRCGAVANLSELSTSTYLVVWSSGGQSSDSRNGLDTRSPKAKTPSGRMS